MPFMVQGTSPPLPAFVAAKYCKRRADRATDHKPLRLHGKLKAPALVG